MIQKKAKTKSVSRVMNTNENTALVLRIKNSAYRFPVMTGSMSVDALEVA